MDFGYSMQGAGKQTRDCNDLGQQQNLFGVVGTFAMERPEAGFFFHSYPSGTLLK